MTKFKKIYIEITNICNKNCSFCSKTNRNKIEMSLSQFENVIKQVKNYTDYIYLHVKGEPLLHSKFDKIIDICSKYNMKVNITTNGSLLKQRCNTIINSKCIRQINISIHSINDIKEMKDILMTVDNILNNRKLYFVYRYWLLHDDYKLENNSLLKEIIEHYNIDSSLVNNIINSNIKINDELYINKDFEFEWPSLNNSTFNKRGFCNGLKTHIAILSDGIVVPCCLDAEGVINLGNINETSLENILKSDKVRNIVNSFKDNKRVELLCQHCSFNR